MTSNFHIADDGIAYTYGLVDGALKAHDNTRRELRDAAVVTAVHVARDWAIEAQGSRYGVSRAVERYMALWLIRNGADRQQLQTVYIADLVEAVWALAELPDQDPLNLVDDDYHGTSDEARAMLTAQYEADLTHALSRITWKD